MSEKKNATKSGSLKTVKVDMEKMRFYNILCLR